MTRRNRKKNVKTLPFPAHFTGFAVVASVLALVYVWIDCRCEIVGREIKRLEHEQSALETKRVNEEYRWARLKAPGNLEHALHRNGLHMSWPEPRQVIRLADRNAFAARLSDVAWRSGRWDAGDGESYRVAMLRKERDE